MYIISHQISEDLKPLWFEKEVYKKENLYSIEQGKLPPVNYDSHTINSHSATHLETSKHTQKNGKTIDWYYNNSLEHFYGDVLVIKLKGNHYKEIDTEKGLYHWEISLEELKLHLNDLKPKKLLITTENYPQDKSGIHDPNYVLTLSQEAADYLISIEGFNLYGTTWKSSDFNSGAKRPIHDTLFKKAVIVELLKLDHVPAGIYKLNAFPLNIKGASESPVLATLQKT